MRQETSIMTRTPKPVGRAWRLFEEARAFAHSLGLPTKAAWDAFCRQGAKPADIPTNPRAVYRNAWRTWSDWLGTGKVPRRGSFLPFVEARRLAHSFGLPNQRAWWAFCRAGNKPETIPADPRVVYPGQFVGWHDWLAAPGHDDRELQRRSPSRVSPSQQEAGQSSEGTVALPSAGQEWSSAALLDLLESLRPLLAHLSEQERSLIRSQGKAHPSLSLAQTGTAPWQGWPALLAQGQEQPLVAQITDLEALAAQVLPGASPSETHNDPDEQEGAESVGDAPAHTVEQKHLPS
jgi:hypothetical protein